MLRPLCNRLPVYSRGHSKYARNTDEVLAVAGSARMSTSPRRTVEGIWRLHQLTFDSYLIALCVPSREMTDACAEVQTGTRTGPVENSLPACHGLAFSNLTSNFAGSTALMHAERESLVMPSVCNTFAVVAAEGRCVRTRSPRVGRFATESLSRVLVDGGQVPSGRVCRAYSCALVAAWRVTRKCSPYLNSGCRAGIVVARHLFYLQKC